MAWASVFNVRGKNRKIEAELIGYEPCDGYEVELQSNDVTAYATLELMSLSKSRTRASFAIELKPKSLSGRLMVQTMRLGKSRLEKRFRKRAVDFALTIERQYNSTNSA